MTMRTTTTLMIALMVSAGSLANESAVDVFQQRIMPIFRSENPSSCVQCHLASVDLKDYILPSHEATFLSLRRQGMIDIEKPMESKILRLIRMGDDDPDALSRRIHAKMRKAEYEAFSDWIQRSCNDEALLSKDFEPAEVAAPEMDDSVIRHHRKDRLLDSFVRNIWSQRMRCFPCHTPGELNPKNPQHRKPINNHRELVKKYGARMNIFAKTPEATMRNLINSTRKQSETHLPMLNLDDPANSLLVLKPTSKLPPKGDDGEFLPPSSVAPVSHMGGLKMHKHDQSYKAFVSWIADFAKIRGQQYQSADRLPPDNWAPTKHVLRVKQVPDTWTTGTVIQLFVHARGDDDRWSAEPIAFTQGTVTPRGFVNGMLFKLEAGAKDDLAWLSPVESFVKLPPGNYRIAAFLDSDNYLAKHPTAFLEESNQVGTAEIKADWQEGFPRATVVDGSQFSN